MSDTFELADEPKEPEAELADETEEHEEPKSSRAPVKPLARLWKVEPDSTDDEAPAAKNISTGEGAAPAKKSSDTRKEGSKGKTKPARAKTPAVADDKTEKKVLIEETPTLDTYESRRRARLIMGSLCVGGVMLCAWIVYSVFLADPVSSSVTASGAPTATQTGASARTSLDEEARFMFTRAQELARNGRTDQSLAMLNRVIKVYKGTAAAKDAKAALDNADKNLPLFSDRPLVVAQPAEAKPAPESIAPPAVVNATPAQPQAAKGQAALVLPVNPAEAMVTPPGAAAQVGNAKPAVNFRPIPVGFQPNLDAGVHESGWPLVIVGDRDGAPMVLVPGGTFTMGINDGQPAEGPEHQVRLSTFYIDQHEVTNRQFRRFLAESPYRGQPPGKWLTDEKARNEPDDAPVVLVNFQDAEAFAVWAAKQLPTEAQWEMAARSSDGRRYPWGNESAKWERARTFRHVDPVMKFREDRSPLGVYDTAGNVHEWTKDWFDHRYYHQFGSKTVADNPTGPALNPRTRTPQRVVRGGAKNWSVTYREPVPPDRRLAFLGFRCVLMVEEPSLAPPPAGPAAQPGAPPAPSTKKPAPPPI